MTRTARIAARIIIVTWADSSTRRFGSASAATPGEQAEDDDREELGGGDDAEPDGSWVSSRTSHACATCCIQVPISEII